MTIRAWTPWLAAGDGPLYQRLVEALRRDLASGRLAPGARLPTHRELARHLGASLVTASRAYREAALQGLVQGEVGRGTFATAAAAAPAAAAGLAAVPGSPGPGAARSAEGGFADLAANHVLLGDEDLGAALAAGGGADLVWEGLSRRYPPGGSGEHRAAAAAWPLRGGGFQPHPNQVVVTSGGQHAILVALAALARPGDTLFVETLTYPGVRAAARLLSLRLVPVDIDAAGLLPESLAARCAGRGGGGLVFCQPSLHNPTSAVMPIERRRELVAVARRHDLTLIEDGVYEFLLREAPPPLAALAPERTCHIASAAKAFLPGMRIGWLIAPEPLVPALQREVAATCLAAAAPLVDLASRWLVDGQGLRQELAGAELAGLSWETHPESSHLWLLLPPPWQAAAFVAEARRHGVEVNPAPAFAVDPEAAQAAVRVCLGAVADRRLLAGALARLAAIATAPPPAEEPVV